MEKKNIFEQIEIHILEDERPSQFITELFENEKVANTNPFTMLSNLKKVDQNKKYHPEGSVWNHTLLVVDEAACRKEISSSKRVFMWAALLHDIGKAPATRIRNGRITSYDHEKIGRDMSQNFLREFTNDEEFIEKVSSLVRWHMEPLFVLKDLPFANIKQMLKEVSLEEVALLSICDRMGRGDMSIKKAIDEERGIQMFVEKCKKYMENRSLVNR